MTASVSTRLAVLLLAGALGAAPAFASPPPWAGGGKKGGDDGVEAPHGKGNGHGDRGNGHGKGNRHDARIAADAPPGPPAKAGKPARPQRTEVRVGSYFNDRDRAAVRTYYGQHYGPGAKSCPPGLAKKNNGCLPPGQAKKWAVGQPLPAGVIVYPVPQPVLLQLPAPPSGYRYVRVASDILLIAIGSRMVIDGMTDLLRM